MRSNEQFFFTEKYVKKANTRAYDRTFVNIDLGALLFV